MGELTEVCFICIAPPTPQGALWWYRQGSNLHLTPRRRVLPIELRYRRFRADVGIGPYEGSTGVRRKYGLSLRHGLRRATSLVRGRHKARGAVPARTARGTPGRFQSLVRRSLSYGRAYGLKGGSYAEQRREVRPPHDDYAIHVNNLFQVF